jgi:hypothetical protein
MKVRARFDDLKEIQGLWPKDLPVVGVGVTAFPRSALGYLLADYMILCLLETNDLEAIRKLCPVVSLEKDLQAKFPEKFNTSEMLQLAEAKKYLLEKRSEGELGLFLYKASKRSNRLAKEMGLKVLSTPGEIRMKFENKREFRVEGEKAGLNLVPGETLEVDDLDEQRWDKYRQELGERLVFQLPDYTVGGGLGTFFINKKDDFKEFKEFVRRRREVREIKIVNVTKFIEGEAASITGCATRYGVVTSLLQKQIMDQPELVGLHGRSGVWLGHDWYMRFSDKEQLRAEKECQKWGEYIYKQGYRGIYGLDVVVDKEGKMWPIECNSRYMGAFPVYTMMQLERGEMPIDVWHLLEWLGMDYEMDLGEVQAVGRQPKEGAHFHLHNIERKFVMVTQDVKAGVYRVKPGGIEWVREGFSLLDIKDKDELVLADKVVSQYTVLKPAERLGRLMFKRKVVDDKGRLLKEIREIVKQVYSQFELMPVERPEGY